MFKIDIHTHIIPHDLNDITKHFTDNRFLKLRNLKQSSADLYRENSFFRKIECNCWNPIERSNEMIHSNVNMQVLSTIPVLFSYWANPLECLELSRYINDHMSETVRLYPNNFFGLGTIPMQKTDFAINEMDRCINDLKLHGIEIGTNINGDNLSEKKYEPIFEHAEKINCPIFVHPWEVMGENSISKYWLPWLVGMPAEISRAICSLIFGGILEKYPNLKIAFAHGGGSFPYTIGRIDKGFTARPDLCAIDNNVLPSHYLQNFYIDSLTHSMEAFKYLINTIGYKKIALGTDFPFPLGESEPGKLIETMNLSDKIKKRIYSGTAFEWLGIDEKKYL